jgi:hypothetical protein
MGAMGARPASAASVASTLARVTLVGGCRGGGGYINGYHGGSGSRHSNGRDLAAKNTPI